MSREETVKTAPPLPDGLPTDLWIGGAPRAATGGGAFDVINPATGSVLTSVADGTVEDALAAMDAAEKVAGQWAATPPRVRAEILRKAFELVTERSEDFATVMTLEMGKILAESRGEVAYGAEFLRWFSEEAVRIGGRTATAPAGTGEIVVTKEPVGMCLAVTPWNFPLAMGTRKIGPALASGCTIIVKPSEDTPLTMLLLAQTFADAGLPPGVLSVVPSTASKDVVAAMMADPRLKKVSFTGSTGVGKELVAQAAGRLQRTSMELGGNAPFLVFDDADLDAALDGAMAAKMRNGGEACTAANRIYVQNSVREEFTRRLTERVAAMTVGPGWQDGVALGAIINERQLSSIAGLVDDARTHGARILTGGTRIEGSGGFFYAPTVLDDIDVKARIRSSEIFGPVAAVVGFDTEDEAVALANDTPYGLASYLYTESLARAQRVARRIESGMVGVNRGVISDAAAPFGGIKESGFGSEGGSEGIEEYLNTKYIAYPPA
ncbi:MAG: NAD-dependent succinate-semialdehyde dehydrogenase [Gordonia sp. (in: high G+C Gram-positive bacteria)]|uniref:NAD-dependent succinate-semialdehyde dehydrogenase n=1 Tax=Gordonia sp. (in: high G+C Gram-positive bacteria) TaxID=84139 RepID=UPI0039E3EF0B